MYQFGNETTPIPILITSENLSALNTGISYGNANFFRTALNSNVQIYVPQGSGSANLWTSPNLFLPSNIYNSIDPIANKIAFTGADILILQDCTLMHEVFIQYKITKSDGTNFANQRECRVTLVDATGAIVYNNNISANNQPNTGDHDFINMKGSVLQHQGELVRIRINLIQDNRENDESDSILTIFRVSWNVTQS